MQVLIHKHCYLMTKDINLDQVADAPLIDSLVSRCITAAFEALRTPISVFTTVQQEHLGQVFKSMRPTHEAIRELLRHEHNSPQSVDAVPLARLQLETLYSICLVLDQPPFLDRYLKNSWKQAYIKHLLTSAECRDLPAVTAELDKQLPALEGLRKLAGVTDEERTTIRCEQLGEEPPPGMVPTPIRPFPTPGTALGIIRDPDRKRMLCRLYFEYQFLCDFVHFSAHPRSFKGIFDHREPFGQLFTSEQRENMFQKEIAGPAIWVDFLSVAQCAAEFVVLYPADVELRRAATDAWAVLSERTIMGRAVWEFRSKKLLGIL
jgi:hypothetical protein